MRNGSRPHPDPEGWPDFKGHTCRHCGAPATSAFSAPVLSTTPIEVCDLADAQPLAYTCQAHRHVELARMWAYLDGRPASGPESN